MKLLSRLLIFTLAIYSVFTMLGCALQRSMIYYPMRAPSAELDRLAARSGFERWTAPDGSPIGWRTKTGDPSLPLLIIHGNAGYALHRNELASRLRAADPARPWHIHILEYPGYGDRPGKPSEKSFYAAASQALDTFTSPPVLLGESIGTGVAVHTAAHHPHLVRGLILVTPFDSLVSVANAHFPFLPAQLILADRFDSAKILDRFPGPVAFLLAGSDEVVPTASGQKLYDLYSGKKRLWVIDRARHNDVAYSLPPSTWREILQFAAEKN